MSAAGVGNMLVGALTELTRDMAGEEGVRKKLEELGVKGRTWSEHYCPIAIYLKRKGFRRISVWPTGVEVFTRAENGAEVKITAISPPAIRWFILQFDRGHYPELERKEKRCRPKKKSSKH